MARLLLEDLHALFELAVELAHLLLLLDSLLELGLHLVQFCLVVFHTDDVLELLK